MTAPHPTVVFIDGDKGVREPMSGLIRDTWGLNCEGYPSAEEYLRSNPECRPGCIVTDHRLPGMDGLSLQKTLLARHDVIPLIIVSSEASVAATVSYMQNGAVTLLNKPVDPESLRQAVDRAFEIDSHRRDFQKQYRELQASDRSLTDRERYVMRNVIDGKLNKVIASDLDVSVRTVENIRARVLRKFQAVTAAELAAKVTVLQLLRDTAYRIDAVEPGERRIPASAFHWPLVIDGSTCS